MTSFYNNINTNVKKTIKYIVLLNVKKGNGLVDFPYS